MYGQVRRTCISIYAPFCVFNVAAPRSALQHCVSFSKPTPFTAPSRLLRVTLPLGFALELLSSRYRAPLFAGTALFSSLAFSPAVIFFLPRRSHCAFHISLLLLRTCALFLFTAQVPCDTFASVCYCLYHVCYLRYISPRSIVPHTSPHWNICCTLFTVPRSVPLFVTAAPFRLARFHAFAAAIMRLRVLHITLAPRRLGLLLGFVCSFSGGFCSASRSRVSALFCARRACHKHEPSLAAAATGAWALAHFTSLLILLFCSSSIQHSLPVRVTRLTRGREHTTHAHRYHRRCRCRHAFPGYRPAPYHHTTGPCRELAGCRIRAHLDCRTIDYYWNFSSAHLFAVLPCLGWVRRCLPGPPSTFHTALWAAHTRLHYAPAGASFSHCLFWPHYTRRPPADLVLLGRSMPMVYYAPHYTLRGLPHPPFGPLPLHAHHLYACSLYLPTRHRATAVRLAYLPLPRSCVFWITFSLPCTSHLVEVSRSAYHAHTMVYAAPCLLPPCFYVWLRLHTATASPHRTKLTRYTRRYAVSCAYRATRTYLGRGASCHTPCHYTARGLCLYCRVYHRLLSFARLSVAAVGFSRRNAPWDSCAVVPWIAVIVRFFSGCCVSHSNTSF